VKVIIISQKINLFITIAVGTSYSAMVKLLTPHFPLLVRVRINIKGNEIKEWAPMRGIFSN
jgi:hypothetical protein